MKKDSRPYKKGGQSRPRPYKPREGVHLCPVVKYPDARKILFDLLKERTRRQSISHKYMPTWEQHNKFCDRPGYRSWYIIADGTVPVGSVYLTMRNEVGLAVFKKYRGRGYGREAFRLLKNVWSRLLFNRPSDTAKAFLANINPQNKESIRFFEKLGFRLLQVTYVYDP